MKTLLINLQNHTANKNRGRLALQRIMVVLLILVFIQALNQFLILTGSWLEKTVLEGESNSGIWVGVFQELLQMVVGLLLGWVLFRKNIHEIGINLRNSRNSVRLFGIFTVVWLSIIVLYVSAAYYVFHQTWLALISTPLPTANTICATLLFQAIFPGLGEEVLFRGFLITLLTALVFPRYETRVASRIGVITLSSLYFATAHIYFTLVPFRITHIDGLQIITALGCGAFYAVVYLKTRSLLAPFLAHNFANVTASICGYIIATF